MPSDQPMPGDFQEPAGTVLVPNKNTPPAAEAPVDADPPVTTQHPKPINEGEGQALESHEVIELQTFSERKAWIEDKIKFLEKLPPIEVFVGLDALRESAEEVPGLPTRAELQQWMAEHDTIEKETEIFDTGELKKLRQLTKAATQRNLSPEDTDVIELTLTTIYELDKLLHLLRDRSEHLELLNVRLSWEELRIAAWVDRRVIITDLRTFLETRARWSPSIYDTSRVIEEPHSLQRRGSVASIASVASGASDTSISSPGFSRSARFKLAELLSRDAAQFASRVTALRHGKIAHAGKALDKLIDNSRKPVPEVLLDEQDKLEERGITEMEHIGKFVMALVMQWRKADEMYVETKKDQVSAQNLLEEIETAKMHHPTGRQSASFTIRADTLIKRISLRGNPTSPVSTFPCPEHPLFPEQTPCNRTLAQELGQDISAAMDMARKVEFLARDYRTAYEAVSVVEGLVQSANHLSNIFVSVIQRLTDGVSNGDGDGSPPNLMLEICLEPTAHSVFVAFLPSILKEGLQAREEADRLVQETRVALLGLDRPGIDPIFKANASIELQKLTSLRDKTLEVQEGVSSRCNRLREARKVWVLMAGELKELEIIQRQLAQSMETQRWKKAISTGETPLTPQSPSTDYSPIPISLPDVSQQLDQLELKLSQDVERPLESFSKNLELPLKELLYQSIYGLTTLSRTVRQMTILLGSIRDQATVMYTLRDEYHDLQIRIEDLKARARSSIDAILGGHAEDSSLGDGESDLQNGVDKIADDVQAFVDSLASRVKFVAHQSLDSTNTTPVKSQFSPSAIQFNHNRRRSLDLPFNLASLDEAVRADSNGFAMRLGGKLEGLQQTLDHLQLAIIAREVDFSLSTITGEINRAVQELNAMRNQFGNVSAQADILAALDSISKDTEGISLKYRNQMSLSFTSVRETLRRMEAAPGSQDVEVRESLCAARERAVEGAALRFKTWEEDLLIFLQGLSGAQAAEIERAEQKRLAELHQLKVEAERLAAEQAEKKRLEFEQLKAQEQLRLEEERAAEERRQQIEKERLASEQAEKIRLEEQKKALEEIARLEAERLAQEARLQLERDRLLAEEVERMRLHRERIEIEEKLRQTEMQLIEERRLQAERERMKAEELERERIGRLQAEREERERLEAQRQEEQKARQLEEERRLQGERERMAKEVRTSQMRQEAEAKEKLRLEGLLKEERRLRAESEKAAADATLRALQASGSERSRNKELVPAQDDDDVFGFRISPVDAFRPQTQEMNDLQVQILLLRKRLRAISINEALRPSKPSAHLPTREKFLLMTKTFDSICADVNSLPTSAENLLATVELRSLMEEIDVSSEMLKEISNLVDFADSLTDCDAALSDFLEHIDSFPAPPPGVLSSSHRSSVGLPPEEQLLARSLFTKNIITGMTALFSQIDGDQRAIPERARILQTWSELEEMATDRIRAKKSRPASTTSTDGNSSGRSSNVSMGKTRGSKKSSSYSSLSVASTSSRGRLLAPPHIAPRRVVSGDEPHRRPSSQLSTASTRSVSGPLSHSLYGSTFASRQRTTSLSNSTPPPPPQPRAAAKGTPLRVRAQANQHTRSDSPAMSEVSSVTRSRPPRSSLSNSTMSTWSRAPRQSLPMPRSSTPQKKGSAPRKTYVADPKNKLDVAVGDVVNNLEVGINIEGVAETWRDQSGKYWIGNQDPKLCFCRILRSQTVMVRVGGGWSELSKFIKDHFADSFRLVSESPPRPGAPEEKWISAATLLEAPELRTPPMAPRTPEPTMPFIPSFSLSTPTGRSPHSIRSSPSTRGSPLTPLQFMRRADNDTPMLRPPTPSKPPLRIRNINTNTQNRNSVWRP